MTPEEIVETYEDLAEVLTASGLGWVVEQVEQTLRAGRPVEKQTRVFKEEDREAEAPSFDEQYGTRRAGKATSMMTLEPWTPTERLLFLIDGVRQAIVHAAGVEDEQLRLLRDMGLKEVAFVSDGEIAPREPLRLTGIRYEGIQTLARLLDALEAEVGS